MKDKTQNQTGEKLKALRLARGLTAYEVAKAVLGDENRYPQIIKWENGTHLPRNGNLAALAQFFLVSTDYLTT